MDKQTFDYLVDRMVEKSAVTLKTKNAKYAPENDALHNFHYGAQMDGSTTAQTIWHYMKKHMVALMDKINRDDFEDIEDTEEKIQDIINYLLFIWCAANEWHTENVIQTDDTKKNCFNCKHGTKDSTVAPCNTCKYNCYSWTEEYKKAPLNWEYVNV